MEKIFEFEGYGAIITFYDHGTHVVEVSMYLDERRTLQPESVVMTHQEAEKKIARLSDQSA